MTNRSSLGAFLCLPLVTVMFWQGSSCRSANSNMSNNSTHAENVNANVSVNSNTPSNAGQSPADVRGVWGGFHLHVEISESGAMLDYDCAHGTIAEKIVPNREGEFSAKGFHIKERPGPTLTVKLSRTNEDIGTFTLTQGKSGRIRKCM